MFDLPLLRQQDILEDYRRRQHHRRRERTNCSAVVLSFRFAAAAHSCAEWQKKKHQKLDLKTREINRSFLKVFNMKCVQLQ